MRLSRLGICALMLAVLKLLRGRGMGVVKKMGIDMTKISQDKADGIVERITLLDSKRGTKSHRLLHS